MYLQIRGTTHLSMYIESLSPISHRVLIPKKKRWQGFLLTISLQNAIRRAHSFLHFIHRASSPIDIFSSEVVDVVDIMSYVA